MTTPTFANIFALYYTLYRGESEIPASTDPEYTIGLQYANEAIARWSTYDSTYWKALFATAQTASTGGVVTVTTGTTSYLTPTAFREAGGFIRIRDASGNTVRTYPIIEPQDAQFRTDSSYYAYFTNAVGAIYTLHLNPAPDSAINGKLIDYVYYKKPTEMTGDSSTTECPNVEFIAHRMLAMRFRVSRNPYFNGALRDSEDALKIMKMANDSGNWADPWRVADNSGTSWGE